MRSLCGEKRRLNLNLFCIEPVSHQSWKENVLPRFREKSEISLIFNEKLQHVFFTQNIPIFQLSSTKTFKRPILCVFFYFLRSYERRRENSWQFLNVKVFKYDADMSIRCCRDLHSVTCLTSLPEGEERPSSASYTFPTEMFFMTHR